MVLCSSCKPTIMHACNVRANLCAPAQADKCFDVLGKCVRSVASSNLKRAKSGSQQDICSGSRVHGLGFRDAVCTLCSSPSA